MDEGSNTNVIVAWFCFVLFSDVFQAAYSALCHRHHFFRSSQNTLSPCFMQISHVVISKSGVHVTPARK